MKKLPILKNLAKPAYLLVALGTTLIFFNINYYLMATLPGEKDNMCVLGAGLNPANLIYTGFLSVAIGILVVGFIVLFSQKTAKNKIAISSLSGFSFVTGTLTVFCTFCTLPVITLFGSSLWVSFFTDYNIYIKIASTLMMLTALYLLNRQLNNECERCVIPN